MPWHVRDNVRSFLYILFKSKFCAYAFDKKKTRKKKKEKKQPLSRMGESRGRRKGLKPQSDFLNLDLFAFY